MNTRATLLRLAAALSLLAANPAGAEPPPPHLGTRGSEDFIRYQQAAAHRAFAIAPGGAWSWVEGETAAEPAMRNALDACQRHTATVCVPYDADGRIVFDTRSWTQGLGPYATRAQAARASYGSVRGQRFPELMLKDATGRTRRISDWRGKVVVLHFWGSWCAPCRHEMPELQALRDALRNRQDIVFVLAQVREPFSAARRWAGERGITLPLYDSGSTGIDDDWLHLADGRRIADRELAAQFPTTTLIDKHGVVLLAHAGPVPRWSEYREFLLDAAKRSGK